MPLFNDEIYRDIYESAKDNIKSAKKFREKNDIKSSQQYAKNSHEQLMVLVNHVSKYITQAYIKLAQLHENKLLAKSNPRTALSYYRKAYRLGDTKVKKTLRRRFTKQGLDEAALTAFLKTGNLPNEGLKNWLKSKFPPKPTQPPKTKSPISVSTKSTKEEKATVATQQRSLASIHLNDVNKQQKIGDIYREGQKDPQSQKNMPINISVALQFYRQAQSILTKHFDTSDPTSVVGKRLEDLTQLISTLKKELDTSTTTSKKSSAPTSAFFSKATEGSAPSTSAATGIPKPPAPAAPKPSINNLR